METNSKFEAAIEEAYAIVGKYTLVAATTGAIPVPSASTAIIAQNAVLVNHIAGKFGIEISMATILESYGKVGVVNYIGKNLFLEASRLVSTAPPLIWTKVWISAIGAATAGLQTYLIGCLTIEIIKNGGHPLNNLQMADLTSYASSTYEAFKKKWQSGNPPF